jgi:PAS domain S-box-containing protein
MRWLPDSAVHEFSEKIPVPDSLPTAEPMEAPVVPKATREVSTSKRPRILIADDNADMRQYLSRLLSPLYEVQSVSDGQAALAVVRKNPPDLVLTDVMMPNLDGFGLLNQLRSDPNARTLPVILLSARASEDSRVEGMQQFADDYVVKPFTARELLARVAMHLKMAEVRAEAAELERRLRLQGDLERKRLRESFTLAPAAMALLSGADHRFSFVNAAFLGLAGGKSRDQILGRTMREAFPELEGQGLDKILDRVYRTGEPFAVAEREITLKRNDRDETVYASFSCHPMRDVDESVNGILVHAVNVTEQVLARNQLEARVKERTAELSEAEVRLRILSNRLMRAQDDERRRLARELHDSAGQMLAALKMNLVPLEQGIARQNPQMSEFAANGIALVDELSKELRTMSYLLHPPLLDEAGLPSALRWYVEGFSERSGIEVTLKVDPALPRLAQEVEMTIFRIAQESLTNIHRHSGSKAAIIELIHAGTNVRVEIRDRGKGITQLNSANNLPMRVGVGIQGMQERVRQLSGRFEIHSGKDGTTVAVALPSQPGAPGTDEAAKVEVA